MRTPAFPSRPVRGRQPTRAVPGPAMAGSLFGKDRVHTLALLRAAWPSAVGPELARRTELLAIEGRTLRVRVPDARWRQVLHRMRRDILSRLYAVAGDLAPAALGFNEGGIKMAPDPPPPPPTVPAPPPPAEVVTAAGAISDPELRRLFLDTAGRYLGRLEETEKP